MVISFADAFHLRGGAIWFQMENCLFVPSNIWVHLPRSTGNKSTHSEFWSIFVFISCCSWEPGMQLRLHHPSKGMCLQGFRYFLENNHPLAAFGQTFCSLQALGNLSVTHLWQGNPRLVGVAWESSWWFMDSEDECPQFSCLKFSLHICPLFREISESLVLKGVSETLDDSAGKMTNRAEKGLQAGWSPN